MQFKVYVASVILGCSALVIYSPDCLWLILFVLLAAPIVIFDFLLVILMRILPSFETDVRIELTHPDVEAFRKNLMEHVLLESTFRDHLPVIFGRTLDSLIQQLLDYIIRDYIYNYLGKYVYMSEIICDNLKKDMWGAVQILHERFSKKDYAKMIACDMVVKVTHHFEKIRNAKTVDTGSSHSPVFELSPHLLSKHSELEFLRRISELLILFLLPRCYSLSPAKCFLREVIACKVLYPAIDNITEPDYFNRNVIAYLESQKVTAAIHKKTFEYANSFEDFLKTIQKSNDVDLLKRFRYDIVTKIMQATTVQNIKRAKGVDPDLEKSLTAGINKSEINDAKKLKLHINQLTFVKKECEKRLGLLGWDVGYPYQDDKIMPLSSILDNVLGRKYLTQFLETLASQGLVGYYVVVEELKLAQQKNWHQIGAEIFYTFIRNPNEINVDKSTRKKMEGFLLGDNGPEVFYEVQKQVVRTLDEKYYQSFINSEFYKEMLSAIENEDDIIENDADKLEEMKNKAITENGHVGDYSNYSRRKLDQLQEKLNNKVQALQALRSSLKPQSRVLAILEKEVEWLRGEKRQLEAHLTRTEIWGENLGKWRAVVQSVDILDESLLFVIVVDMIESESIEANEEISSGWVVSRTLLQFQELHKKLRPVLSDIKHVELPSQSFMFLFGKIDRATIDKAKMQIQKYLKFVLENDRLNQSEAIYSFLSPSSDHLKHATASPKKSKFSLSTLFKSDQASKDVMSTLRESEDDGISQSLDGVNIIDGAEFQKTDNPFKFLDDAKDSIAEPLYSLMSEIFDMRGLFKYLRKTLIAFVQITYGRTINRQIYDSISWCFSEQMLHYYISLVIKTWWPTGSTQDPAVERSEKIKRHTAAKAKEQFVSSVPEILVTLVGASAARNGATKVFDTLQNKILNKQLFYDLFETVTMEAFPELNKIRTT